jgi:hypothetical protein
VNAVVVVIGFVVASFSNAVDVEEVLSKKIIVLVSLSSAVDEEEA